MTRDEAKDIVFNYALGQKINDGINTLDDIIDQIFDDHEALQQPKSCAKCKAFKLDDEHNDDFGQCFWDIHFPNGDSSSYHKGTDFYCSEFEAKG